MTEVSTPLMRQYSAIKKEHPQALLFFRLGDFYELFFDDAVVAARELEITLTSRNKEKGIAIPMCGVPHHAADGYIAKLIRKGFKVAICEQMEDPRVAKKLVRREVTRIVTPGTAVDSLLSAEENNFLAAVCRSKNSVGFAALDLSTGEFRATQFDGQSAEHRITEELEQLRPREVLYASSLPLFERPSAGSVSASDWKPAFTPLEDWAFAADYAVPLVENHFGVLSLEGFGLTGRSAAACAAGAVLHYIRSTQRGTLEHVDRIGYYERQSCLMLDAITVRNLEIIDAIFAVADDAQCSTLFQAVDATLTPMGKRLLRGWMLRPSIEMEEINQRLQAVDALLSESIRRDQLRHALGEIQDIERLLSRVTLETANARDLLGLAASLAKLPELRVMLEKHPAQRIAQLREQIDELADVRTRIETTIAPEPPLSFADGGLIASGVDASLDELRDLSRNSRQYIAHIEQRERGRCGIASLKVKFNSVFGYYIEVSRPNLHLVPPDYERKQTLVNAERFTTPELKEYEARVLDAQEKIVELERRIFTELRSAVAAEAKRIRQTALAVAQADVLASFAHIASNRGYCRPQFTSDDEIQIIAGRHPVVELQQSGQSARFVPNDLYLNSSSEQLLLITGPNMGGKSTYLRQTALIVLMAQMGSFVPAQSARLGIVDRIFTRIGASDNLARGRSTFMVEMTETGAILNSATPRSLILLDEIGRGTATYDGLAIAWAAIEFIHTELRAKTLFATHYHELTQLAEHLPRVKNFQVSVKESPPGIVFLRKVLPGAASRSYGIEVARLAGLPPSLIARAREVLAQHENTERRASAYLSRDPGAAKVQVSFFDPHFEKVANRLRAAEVEKLTPIEALNLLHALKKDLD